MRVLEFCIAVARRFKGTRRGNGTRVQASSHLIDGASEIP